MLVFLLLLACKGDPEAADKPTPGDDAYVPPDLPVLAITAPERGVFTGSDQVRIQGSVLAGSAALDTIEVNDAGIRFDGGRSPGGTATFDSFFAWEPGINIIGVRTDDVDGERALDGRAIYAGPTNEPGETLESALRLQVGPELLDDDDAQLDDIAAVAEVMLGDDSLVDSMLGQPMESDYFVLTPTAISWTSASVDIVPYSGSLEAGVTLYDVWMDFDIDGTGLYSWLGTDGSAWVDSVDLVMLLDVSSSGGTVQVTPSSTGASLAGYGITVDWFPDSLEGYLAEWTQDTLEDEIAGAAEDMVGELLADYLNSFVVDFEIIEGVTLNLALDSLQVATDGLRFSLDAGVTASTGIELPSGAGSAKTEGEPPSWPITTTAPFGAACDDDFVNQLFFAFWAGGSLSGLSFSGTEIGGMSGAELPEPIGPAERVDIAFNLPPMVAAATQDDQDADLAIGELRMVFTREDGELLDFSVNVRTGLTMALDGGAIDLALDGRPSMMVMEIGVPRYPEGLDPGDLSALIRLMVPPLLSNATMFMPSLEVPGVPLDSFSDSPELAGKELGFDEATVAVDAGGWIVFTSEITAR